MTLHGALENLQGVSLSAAPAFHHVAIQTNDLDNAVSWYEEFFGARPAWSLNTFSELTRRRLPGICRLTELVIGEARLHVMEREGRPAPDPSDSIVQFQHFCLSVNAPEDLFALRQRWIELFRSGRYTFALKEQPTEVVIDSDGVQSFYAYDPNGLEFEFTHVPRAADRER